VSDAIMDLLLQGDFIRAVVEIYTSVMGQAFYAAVLLALSVPLYIRTQSLAFVAAVWLLVWGVLQVVMPAPAVNFGVFMMALAAGVLIYSLFVRSGGR